MSRSFAPNDQMNYTNSAGDGTNLAFGTGLVVVKITAANGVWQSFMERNTGGTNNFAMSRNGTNNQMFTANQASGSTGPAGTTLTSADGWFLFASTKATGSNAPIHYKIPIGGSTATGAADTALANYSTGTGSVTLGGPSDFATILLAVAAIFKDSVLSQATIEGIASAKTTQSILDAGATWCVDDSDGLATDLVGSVDLTSDTGTSDSADDPSGWAYFGGGGPITKTGSGLIGP